jgi:hypothetical protein
MYWSMPIIVEDAQGAPIIEEKMMNIEPIKLVKIKCAGPEVENVH